MVWFIALVLELQLPVEPSFLVDKLDQEWRCQGEVAGFYRDAPQRILREDQHVVMVEVEARRVGVRLYTRAYLINQALQIQKRKLHCRA